MKLKLLLESNSPSPGVIQLINKLEQLGLKVHKMKVDSGWYWKITISKDEGIIGIGYNSKRDMYYYNNHTFNNDYTWNVEYKDGSYDFSEEAIKRVLLRTIKDLRK